DFGDRIGTSTEESPTYKYNAEGNYAVKLIVATNTFGCLDSVIQNVFVDSISASVTPNHAICANESTTLVASGGESYVWKELDGAGGNVITDNVSTLATFITDPLTTTTVYRVVIETNNCIDSLETVITVWLPNTIDVGNDQIICEGESATLTAENNFTNYNWVSLPDGATFAGQTIIVTPTTTSQFALTANDANGCIVRDTLQVTVNPNPIVSFTLMGSCGLNRITFNSTSTAVDSTIIDWNCNFGDGNVSNGISLTNHTYAVAGTYQVTLAVTTNLGCKDSIIQEIIVGSLPITISADQSICPNEQTTLVASGGTTYLWEILDSNGDIINANAGTQATYTTMALTDTTTFRVVVSDNNCTDSLETTVNIFVPAILDAGVDQTICEGEMVNLDAQTGFINYEWLELPGGAAYFGPNIIVNPTQNTQYILSANDGNGCMVTDTVEVFINETPIAAINNENPILCPVGPNDLVLIALPQMGLAPYIYSWTGPNGFAATDSIVTRMNPSEDMSGVYTLQITDANGCMSEIVETEIIVRSTLDEPILSYSGPACEGETITLTTQTYAGEQVQFIWTNNGDTLNSISHQLVINPASLADTGEYAVTVIVNECAAFSDTLMVEVYERPAGTIATVAPQVCVTGSEDLTLIALPTNGTGNYTYQWTGPNGFTSADSIATIVNISAANSGNYQLIIANENGCNSFPVSTQVDITDGQIQPILTANGPICENESISLEIAQYIGNTVTYTWRKNGTLLPSNNNNQLILDPVSIADTGTYEVQVEVDGCMITSNEYALVIYQQPTTSIASVSPQTCVTGSEELALIALPA
ncbi:MAG: PKD domain-containing protein, partial [Saprospiraceae bacterium]